MKKSLYLHIGKPKCGSTFLQKNIFPNSRYKFIGKPHNFKLTDKNKASVNNFNYFIIKKLLLKGGISNLNKRIINALKDTYVEDHLIISEELITCSLLFEHQEFLLLHFTKKFNSSDPKEAFQVGYLNGYNRGVNNNSFTEYDVVKRIQNLSEAFDRDINSIAIVERDFGEWVISLFLQLYALTRERSFARPSKRRALPESFFNLNSLYGFAGFAIGIEVGAQESGRSFGISSKNCFSQLEYSLSKANLITINYSKNNNIFKNEIVKKLSIEFSLRKDINEILESAIAINKTNHNNPIFEAMSKHNKELNSLFNNYSLS